MGYPVAVEFTLGLGAFIHFISFDKHITRKGIHSSKEICVTKRLIKDLVRKDSSLVIFPVGKHH